MNRMANKPPVLAKIIPHGNFTLYTSFFLVSRLHNMAFLKFLIVFFALFAVVCAQNNTATPTPTPAPATNTWTVLDHSTAGQLSLIFWTPAANGTQQQAYQLTAPATTTSGSGYFSGAFSKSFKVSSAANGTDAIWVLTGDTTGDTYFTANVTYTHGPIATIFTLTVLNVTGVSGTTVNATNVSPASTNPSTTEAFFNNKGAFFEIKSGSTSFTSNATTVSSSLSVSTAQTTTATVIVVDFAAAAYAGINGNTTNTDSTYTVYIGAGSPPGGHVVLIIIICVAAGVVLSIIIFVVIYLRRRRNYERID